MVVGDLMLDVVLTPSQPLELGTDVPGRVAFRQGGSAATTARGLRGSAAATTFICAVGRDAAGRALTDAWRRTASGCARSACPVRGPGDRRGRRAGRGAVVRGGSRGGRSADARRPAGELVRAVCGAPSPGVFAPDEAPGRRVAGRRPVARASGARVSVDLASVGPLLAAGAGRGAVGVGDVAPDVVFATAGEARRSSAHASSRCRAGADRGRQAGLARRHGAGSADSESVLRFEVATKPLPATDSTGAGDAFDAGSWRVRSRRSGGRGAAGGPPPGGPGGAPGGGAAALQSRGGDRPGMSDRSDVLTLIDVATR